MEHVTQKTADIYKMTNCCELSFMLHVHNNITKSISGKLSAVVTSGADKWVVGSQKEHLFMFISVHLCKVDLNFHTRMQVS